jgi:hypothetical protein
MYIAVYVCVCVCVCVYVCVDVCKPVALDVVTRNCELCSTMDNDDVIEQGHVHFNRMVSVLLHIVMYMTYMKRRKAGPAMLHVERRTEWNPCSRTSQQAVEKITKQANTRHPAHSITAVLALATLSRRY